MPCYEITHYYLHGEKENLERFIKTVNETPDIRPENSYGRLWLGNFVAFALGLKDQHELEEYLKENKWVPRFEIRGMITPAPVTEKDNDILTFNADGMVEVEVMNAYARSRLFEKLLTENFRLEFAFASINETDYEQYYYDPKNIIKDKKL